MNSLSFSHLLLTLSLALASLFTPFIASAQPEEDPPPAQQTSEVEAPKPASSGFFDQEHRQRLYEKSRLSTTRALLYTLALPGLGNFYAEQYALGTVAMSAFVFGAFFLTYALLNNHDDLIRLGAALGIAAYAGGALSSYIGVNAYNKRLRQGLHLNTHHLGPLTPPGQVFGLGWSWAF